MITALFCTAPDRNEHTICHISEVKWLINKNEKK
jgi:hypothetical protein